MTYHVNIRRPASAVGHFIGFAGTSVRERQAVNSQKIQGPGVAVMFSEIFWLHKTHVIPKAVIDKMQAYPTPQNMRERKTFAGILGF